LQQTITKQIIQLQLKKTIGHNFQFNQSNFKSFVLCKHQLTQNKATDSKGAWGI